VKAALQPLNVLTMDIAVYPVRVKRPLRVIGSTPRCAAFNTSSDALSKLPERIRRESCVARFRPRGNRSSSRRRIPLGFAAGLVDWRREPRETALPSSGSARGRRRPPDRPVGQNGALWVDRRAYVQLNVSSLRSCQVPSKERMPGAFSRLYGSQGKADAIGPAASPRIVIPIPDSGSRLLRSIGPPELSASESWLGPPAGNARARRQ